MGGLGLLFMRRGIQAHPSMGSGYIRFQNEEVERICVANFSSDGIGVTKDDAAKVTSLGTIFRGNSLISSFEELTYFINLQKIGNNAFNSSSLQTIGFPKSIQTIGETAFLNAPLNIEIDLPNLMSLGSRAFDGCRITKIKSLGNLQEIVGGAYISQKQRGVFSSNTELIEVNLPDTLTKIGYGAFSFCSTLPEITIPLNVTTIEEYAFGGCTSLSTIFVKAITPPALHSAALSRTPIAKGEGIIYVPDESVEAYKSADVWKSYATSIYPISTYRFVIIPYNTTIYESEVKLITRYMGEEVIPQYSIQGDIATIDSEGNLVFASQGSVVVTAMYNGETTSTTIQCQLIAIEHDVKLKESGEVTAATGYSVVGFVQTNGATSIKWGCNNGSIGILCEYTGAGARNDYWGATSNPRTVSIKSSSTQVKATFATAGLDDAYIYDNTNGKYLWKGKNIQ